MLKHSALALAIAVLAAAFLRAGPQSARASDLCGNTGSPFGPFNLQTYEAADYKNVYARTLELAGFNQLFPDLAGFAMPALEAGDRAAGSGQPGAPYIPPVLLKSIAWLESGWAQASYDPLVQYGEVGPVLVSHDCGYGIMQVTSGMQNVSGVPNLDQAMIGGHYAFNIARGARILADKWNSAPEYRPIVGNRDSHIIENWYYALWGYNGFAFKNHPLNEAYNPQREPYRCDGTQTEPYPYQEKVLGCVANPPVRGGTQLWNPQPVHQLDLSDPAFAEPLKLENWAPCSQSVQCAPMDIPTPNTSNQDPTQLTVTRSDVIGSPTLVLSTGSIPLVAPAGGQSQTVSLAIGNTGSGVLAWRLSASAPWLKLSRVQGVSLGDDLGYQHQIVDVHADASSLLPGTHSAQLIVESLYSGGVPAAINVTVQTADGALVLGPDGRVFVLQGGLRRHVTDPATFEAEGYSWSNIIFVPETWLAAIPMGHPLPSVLATGRLIQPEGDQIVYVIENGNKRYVTGPDVISGCGYGWGSLVVVSRAIADSLPTGPPLAGAPCPRLSFANGTLLLGADGRVSVVQWDKRRWITSPAALGDCGYRFGNINRLADAINDQLAPGADLHDCTTEGSLLWTEDGRIHLVQARSMRYITDPVTFELGGFDGARVAPAGALSLPAGPPLLSMLNTGVLLHAPDDQATYVIDNGAKRYIPGPDLFTACGYAWAGISILSSANLNSIPTGQPLQTSPCPTLNLPFATLVRGSDSAIWVTLGQSRKWVNSPGAFTSCGYQFDNVNPVPDALLAGSVAGTPISSCTADGSVLLNQDGNIYVVRWGWKRRLPNPATFEASGLSWAAVTPAPDGLPTGKPLLNVVATGRLVRPADQALVYVMDSGAKRYVTGPDALSSCGYAWNAVTLMSAATVAALPEAGPVNAPPCPQPSFEDGTLLSGSDGRVWVTFGGQRRWIAGPDAFVACGYQWGDMNLVSDSIIGAVPDGGLLPAPPCP
jgi:hypothetical protein